IENCYDGAQYYNLPKDTTRDILLAALFHDFNHSGGKLPDNENIKNAVSCIQALLTNIHPLVIDCIECTEYPFVKEPLTIEQRIIRDADLMQFRYTNWMDMIGKNLRKEMEVRLGKTITD